MLKSDALFFFIIGVVFALSLLFCGTAVGAEVRKLAFTAGQYQGENREPYLLLDDERLQHITYIEWDVDLACSPTRVCWFWDNTIIGKATDRQYRFVSWEFETGLRFSLIDVVFNHTSEHYLEGFRTDIRFPLENWLGFRLNFINKRLR